MKRKFNIILNDFYDMYKLERKELPVEEYIKTFKHIEYCEVLVKPNGYIIESIPSHQISLMALARESGVDLDEIPIYLAPNHYLSELLNVVMTQYNLITIPPKYTEEQLKSIITLLNYKALYEKPDIYICREYSYRLMSEGKLSKEEYSELETKTLKNFKHELSLYSSF